MITNIDDIIARSDLVAVIERVAGITFKRAGSNMKAFSPFTDEKTPSFMVSMSKGIWKCFSSGRGGVGPASFIMEYRGVTYPEAIEELAEISGEIVIYDTKVNKADYIRKKKEERTARDLMITAVQKAHDYYVKKSSITGIDAATELAGKVYEPTTLKKWGLVITGDALSLSKASATWPDRSALIDAGLLKESKHNNGYYDFFHSRLIFPLFDRDGRVIAYNGRILQADADKKTPKYINSPESIIYSKGEYVYGFNQQWRNIADKGMAYLCEGPTDVIMLDQAGINNAVCSMGTAFTADQAAIIATCADQVIVLPDGDKPGHGAIAKAVQIIIAAQMDAKVKIIPSGDDPASYITREGLDAFRALEVVDGIEWILQQECGDMAQAGPHERAAVLSTAAKLLADIKSEQVRTQYYSTISKMIDVTATVLKNAVKDEAAARLDKKSKLTREQEQTKMLYGVYEDGHRYYDHNGIEISNFVVKPLFLISYGDSAQRAFEIVNKYGFKKIVNMNSDDFVTLAGFRRATEMLGSFIFKGNDAQFVKIREWIYNDMREVTPIETMGYQPRSGIYAWSNGITLPGTNEVREVNEYGIVEYEDSDGIKTSYWLPGESKINVSKDEDYDHELEKHFRWEVPPSGSRAPRDLKGWAEGFSRVFGDNASIALCYVMASVHRDLLHRRYSMFPHLNLFGPAGSGKTFMAQIITGIFGKPMRAVHLVSSSQVAFYRRIAQTRNAIVWYEEYSEKVSPEKQEALKNFADGFGRVTGQMTNNNKTKSTPVLNACIISGQILPGHDPALLERCITLSFDKYYGDKKSMQYGEQFKEWTNDGIFAFVAAEIFSHREYVEQRFADKMEEVRDLLRSCFQPTTMPSDRVMNNFSMIATVYLLIADKVPMPYTMPQILDMCVVRMQEQSRAVEGVDELSGFFSILVYLITMGKERNGSGISDDHYAVEYHRQVKVKVTETETRDVVFDRESKLLFLRLNHAHTMYMKEGRSMLPRVVDKHTLMRYMRQHRSWVGEMKAKKINDKPQRCIVFNLELLPDVELEETTFFTKPDATKVDTSTPPYNPKNIPNEEKPSLDGDLFENPFE